MNCRRQSENFQIEEYPFSKNVQGIGKIYHELLLLLKISQTTPQVRNMNINYYDLSYTVNNARNDKEILNDKNENNDNNNITFNVFITCNHYIGRKKNYTVLR